MNYTSYHLPAQPPRPNVWSSTNNYEQSSQRRSFLSTISGNFATNTPGHTPYFRNQPYNVNINIGATNTDNNVETSNGIRAHTTVTDSETLNAALTLLTAKNRGLNQEYIQRLQQSVIPTPLLQTPYYETSHVATSQMNSTSRLVQTQAPGMMPNNSSLPPLPCPRPYHRPDPGPVRLDPQGSFGMNSTANSTTNMNSISTLTSNNSSHWNINSSSLSSNSLTSSSSSSSSCTATESSKKRNLSAFLSSTRSISLSLPEDEDMLSPLHCFMRKYCIEAFTISENDKEGNEGTTHSTTSGTTKSKRTRTSKTKMLSQPKKPKIKFDVVGIRCLFCKHHNHHERADRSITYPSSVNNIYYSMETWQRRHAAICKSIPQWAKRDMVQLATSSKGIGGGRRRYWAESAAKLGMVDTDMGIRFRMDLKVNAEPSLYNTNKGSMIKGCESMSSRRCPRSRAKCGASKTSTTTIGTAGSLVDTKPASLVSDTDKSIVTNFLFQLVSQMERCEFTEEDRSGGRSKIKTNRIGFPGIQCKYCCGRAGYGRYFPASVASLNLANSDRNIFNHLMKCRKCPKHVSDELRRLRKIKKKGDQKIERGGRKIFFKKVWDRLHGPTTSNGSKQKNTPSSCDTSSILKGEEQVLLCSTCDTSPLAKEEEEEEPISFVAL
jgi:hypothetical protein